MGPTSWSPYLFQILKGETNTAILTRYKDLYPTYKEIIAKIKQSREDIILSQALWT